MREPVAREAPDKDQELALLLRQRLRSEDLQLIELRTPTCRIPFLASGAVRCI
jgi:hypothetical protein